MEATVFFLKVIKIKHNDIKENACNYGHLLCREYGTTLVT